MVNRKRCLLAGVAAVAFVAATASIDAWPLANRTTYLTFNRAVALPGVELSAGTYIFELVMPGENLNLVRVTSRDRRKVYLMAFTRTVERPRDLRPTQAVTFGEMSGSAAPPIAAWYPSGLDNGRQFIYRR